jgi:hypothetical protein
MLLKVYIGVIGKMAGRGSAALYQNVYKIHKNL